MQPPAVEGYRFDGIVSFNGGLDQSPSRAMKFTSLALATESLPRQRLLEAALCGDPQHANSTILLAPAGFGKTTLLVQVGQVLSQSKIPIAWLNCTADDAQPDVFLADLADALQEAGLFRTPSEYGIGDIAAALSENAPAAIFLDEYENAGSEGTDNTLETLIRSMPADCKAFIATRNLPRIGLSKLLVENEARLIDARSLQFTPDEATTLISDIVPREDCANFLAQTDGWPVMLQLVRLYSRVTDTASAPQVAFDRRMRMFDYIAEQILSRLDEAQKQFLLEIAILPEVDAVTAEAVSKRINSEKLLHELLRLSPIVTIISDTPLSVRLHPLLRDYLQQELTLNQPERAAQLHRRAALHYAALSNLPKAVEHAAASGSADLTTDFIERAGGALVNVSEGLGRVRSFLAALAPNVVHAHRELRLMRVLQQVMEGTSAGWFDDFDRLVESEAETIGTQSELDDFGLKIELIRYIRQMSESRHAICDAPWRRIDTMRRQTLSRRYKDPRYHALALTVEALLLTNYGTLQLARKRVEELEQLFVKEHFALNLPWVTTHLANIALAQGDLPAAASHSRTVLERLSDAGEDKNTMLRQHCNAILGQAFYDQNNLELALAHFEAIPRLSAYTLLNIVVPSVCTRARALFYLGHTEQALAGLDEAYQFAVEEELPHFSLIAAACAAELRLLLSDVDAASHLIKSAGLERHLQKHKVWFARPWLEVEAVVRAIALLWLQQKQGDQAYSLTHEFATRAFESGRSLAALRSELLVAQVALKLGRQKQARAAMLRAVNHRGTAAAVRAFLEADVGVRELFSEMAHEDEFSRPDLVGPILRAYQSNGNEAVETLASLSPREQDVIVQLSRGFASKMIGRELGISHETVRHHLKRIYSKFGVNSRKEAVFEARRRGLIP